MEPSWTRNKAQAGFAKPVSENGSMEHCGLGLLGAKGHQWGFEKLGQNPSAGQGVKENVKQKEKWENGSGWKHKGIFFLCSDVQGSQQLWLARSRRDRGIKAAKGSIWDLPAERHQCVRALLTIPLLSFSSLTWQLGRSEALEGMLRNGVGAVLRDSAQILVHPCVSQRWRGDSSLGPLVALLSCSLSPCLPCPGDRGAPNNPKPPVLWNCAASGEPE